jgi:hypothetical protein
MTAFVFFIFKSAGEGEGWFEGDLINSLQKKQIIRIEKLFVIGN